MITLKRILQATIFVVLHAILAILFMAYVNPSWLAGCGILAAAFATLMLVVFAADEQSAKLFFFENWRELEGMNSPNIGLVFVLVIAIWLLPVVCFLLAFLFVALIRASGF